MSHNKNTSTKKTLSDRTTDSYVSSTLIVASRASAPGLRRKLKMLAAIDDATIAHVVVRLVDEEFRRRGLNMPEVNS